MPPRTRVRRMPSRGVYDRREIDAILDEGLICHLAVVEDGAPIVTPTLYARIGDELYLHGSSASRTLRLLEAGAEVCLNVTLLDGLVLARSAFHHSANYRSVTVFGRAVEVDEPAEKLEALRAFTERTIPGRWDEVRPPTSQELRGTAVFRVALDESSAKVRSGPPADDEEDYALPVWAGVLPMRRTTLAPEPDLDPRGVEGVELPGYLAGLL